VLFSSKSDSIFLAASRNSVWISSARLMAATACC
jgi:hypothetical protein